MALQLGAYWQAAVSLAVLIAYARISLMHLALMWHALRAVPEVATLIVAASLTPAAHVQVVTPQLLPIPPSLIGMQYIR